MNLFIKIFYFILTMLIACQSMADSAQFEISYKTLFQNPTTNIDSYRKLRDEYTQYCEYDPSADRYISILNRGEESLINKDYLNAIKYLSEVIKLDPINAPAHYMLYLAYDAVQDSVTASLHKQFSDSLIESILSSGEFGNPKKPFHVVTDYEVSGLIGLIGGTIDEVLTVIDGENGHGLYVHATKNDTGEKGIFYFETNKIVDWEKSKK